MKTLSRRGFLKGAAGIAAIIAAKQAPAVLQFAGMDEPPEIEIPDKVEIYLPPREIVTQIDEVEYMERIPGTERFEKISAKDYYDKLSSGVHDGLTAIARDERSVGIYDIKNHIAQNGYEQHSLTITGEKTLAEIAKAMDDKRISDSVRIMTTRTTHKMN